MIAHQMPLDPGMLSFGLLQVFPEPSISEMLGWSGYDFVIIDREHGIIDEAKHVDMLRAIAGAGAVSLIRTAPHDGVETIIRYLDFGADGILISHLESAEQAETAVRAASTGPGGGRTGTDGMNRRTHFGFADATIREPLLLGLIETARAVENIADILDVEGFHGVMIGPHDLSGDLGTGRDYGDDRYRDALHRIEDAALRSGKLLGGIPHGDRDIATMAQRGYSLIMLGADIMLYKGVFARTLEQARQAAGPTD